MTKTPASVPTPLAKVQGKTAFITGGSSGIGLGLARVLSAAGMQVAFTYKSTAHRDAALASFPQHNAGVHAIELDTTDRDGMVRAADEAERVFGNVHLLCNNAGIGIPAQISNVTWQDWDWALDVNLNGVFNGIRTFLPRMQQHGEGGHIMVTASSAGILVGTLGVYVTTKFAVVGMMESLREELVGQNIGVSIYCPGLVKSEIFNLERNRPAKHGIVAAQGAPSLVPGHDAPPVDFMAAAMDAMEAGRLVLQGIRRNDLYILSHPEFAPSVRQRLELIMASFSQLPVPEARRQATQFILPRVYAAELAKQGVRVAAPRKPAAKAKPVKRKTKPRAAVSVKTKAKRTVRPAKRRRR